MRVSLIRAGAKQLQVIGCANGAGGRVLGCEFAAKVMQQSQFMKRCKIPHRWTAMISEAPSGRQLAALPGVQKLSEQLAHAVHQWTVLGSEVLVIGGDHSCAIGTWSGVAKAMRHRGRIGLIWVDAHLDSHTPSTSDSGNIHGMPVAHLLGLGDKRLSCVCDFAPKIYPANLVFIGTNSFEPAERELIELNRIRIFEPAEVDKKGVKEVLNEAIKIATTDTVGFGMSIDVDAFSPEDAPAAGTPDGLVQAKDFISAIQDADLTHLIATEIVEFLPRLDKSRVTEKLVVRLIESIYGNRFARLRSS